MGYGLLKIIGNGTIRKLKYGLLFAFHSDISYIVLEIKQDITRKNRDFSEY